jgi:histidine triad (HIT) family protein
MSIVIPKEHLSSNVSSLPPNKYSELWLAAKEVALKLQISLGVSRCALVAEGTGVDHAHIKIYPLHGYEEGTTYEMHQEQVFDHYPGFITTLEGPVADNDSLCELAQKIRGTKQHD